MKLVSCNIRGQEQYYTVVITYRDENRTGLKVSPLTVPIHYFKLKNKILFFRFRNFNRSRFGHSHFDVPETETDVESTSW